MQKRCNDFGVTFHMLLLKSEAILTVKCQIGLSIKRSLMSSLSAMAVCYIHGCLEFFDFHISSGKKKDGAECWWLCPRFPELMHCLSIFLLDLIICVQHHYCKEPRRTTQCFQVQTQYSNVTCQGVLSDGIFPFLLLQCQPSGLQVLVFIYLCSPDENAKPPAPPPIKKRQNNFVHGVTLDSVPHVTMQHTNNLSYWAVPHSYKYFKVNLSI